MPEQTAHPEAPAPVPPALSKPVHRLLLEWEGLSRLPYPRDSAFREDEDAFDRRCVRLEALLAELARTRCRTPLDVVAKVTVLCRSLREDASPGDADAAQTLALADNIRDGLTLLALLHAPSLDEEPLLP